MRRISDQNVEIVRRNYSLFRETWDRVKAGDDLSTSPLWELWDKDAVIVEIADLPDTDTYRGHGGIVQWWMNWSETFENAWLEPRGDFLTHGDHVVVQTHQRFLSKMGIEVEQDITHVFTLRDGKLLYATGYRDRSKALEAVGLSE